MRSMDETVLELSAALNELAELQRKLQESRQASLRALEKLQQTLANTADALKKPKP